MSGHWMDGADARLVAALSQSREIARGLAGMAEPPIHAQGPDDCTEGPDCGVFGCATCYGYPAANKSEHEPDCRDLAAGLATAAKEVE
jgi:hypothetical protein